MVGSNREKRRASLLPRRGFENLFDALETEALFIRVRRSGESAARAFFEFAIHRKVRGA